MEHDYLLTLKQHPTWQLLRADNAPLIISFFYRVFIAPNNRSLKQQDITEKLTDTLHHLRQIHGDKLYLKTASAYLNDWTNGEQAFLRKYLPPQGDEPEYDLTPASEKAITWLISLEQKQFIGTESRLLAVFELLNNILQSTQTDPEQRIAELQRQKAAIEQEIAQLQHGAVISYEPRQVRERFQLLQETARGLLMDFRQVEENFRQLDRHTRERIALSNKSKGELLDEIFGEHDTINDSDQGKSFRAFWGLLMSPAKQDRFNQLIQDVLALPDIQTSTPDKLLPKMKHHLLEAGEKVQRTSSGLVDQLRRYLDGQAQLENKRIIAIIHDLEKTAIAIKQNPPTERDFMLLDDTKANIKLPLSQPLFRAPNRAILSNEILTTGSAEFISDAFYQQHHIDVSVLQNRIYKALQTQNQISLETLCQHYPLEKGLSELIAYLHLACQTETSLIDSEQTTTIHWQNAEGITKSVIMPKIIFTR
jgi:hypothetical protein